MKLTFEFTVDVPKEHFVEEELISPRRLHTFLNYISNSVLDTYKDSLEPTILFKVKGNLNEMV